MLIERGLITGLRSNMLVFDNQAPHGQFTKRLLALMRAVAKRRGFYIERIYLYDNSFADVVEWIPGDYFYGDVAPVKFWGIELHFLEELDEDGVYMQMYKAMGGALQGEDSYLAIGTDGTNFLLGSY
jgi:hypothetical protein